MQRLEQALRPAVKGRPRVQLLLCWLGTEEEPISAGRTIDLAQLLAPEFQFRNGEILTVIQGGAEPTERITEGNPT